MHSIHALAPPHEHHQSALNQPQQMQSALPQTATTQVQVQPTAQESSGASLSSPSTTVTSATTSSCPQVTAQSAAGSNQQELSQQQMHPSSSSELSATEAPSIILLESLNPQVGSLSLLGSSGQQQGEVQQLTSLMDASSAIASQTQAQQPHIAIQHHLVQASNQQQQQPHLHQLQPSHNSVSIESTGAGQMAASSHHHHQQQQHQHQHHSLEESSVSTGSLSARNNLLRQRPQIEGIVAEGGGPIVQWLLDNYEIAEGESLPRSTVYNHYLAHCRSLQMASVNAASFGKLIRSVFIGLKTRRLGTRGHSKYHYFGVRAKQHCEQELLQHQQEAGCSRDYTMNNENSNQNTDNADSDESDSTTNNGAQLTGEQSCGRLSSSSSSKRVKRVHGNQQAATAAAAAASHLRRNALVYQEQHELNHTLEQQQPQAVQQHEQHDYYIASSNSNGYVTSHPGNGLNQSHCNKNFNMDQQQQQQQQQQHDQLLDRTHCELVEFSNHLGANWTTLVDEHWPQREAGVLERQLVKACGSNETAECLETFEQSYKLYYKRMVELLSKLKFMEVELLTQEFWHPSGIPPQDDVNSTLWMPQSQAPALSNGTSPQQQQQTNELAVNQVGIDHNLHHHHQQPQHLHHHHHHHHHHLQHPHSHHHQQQQQNSLLQQHHHHQSPRASLTFHQLYQLTSQSLVISRINQIDYHLYDAIESFLLPDMLSPIPRALAQHIRQFAKNIAPWIEMAVKEYEPQFVAEKSKSALAFGSALRRYTSLNHLSTASRAIWDKRSALAQMSLDLSRVDLRDIEHQVSLMSRENNNSNNNNGFSNNNDPASQPDHPLNLLNSHNETRTDEVKAAIPNAANVADHQQQRDNNDTGTNDNNTQSTTLTDNTNNTDNLTISNHQHPNHHSHLQRTHHMCAMQPAQLIQNFLHLLEHPYPANSWPEWCRNLVESRVCGLSTEEARNFVLKWNFYISLIMKELTLKSAPSFGSFQLIRLLFDEYIFYLVVNRLAQAQHKTPSQLLSL